jgi:hypothetical protein
MCSSAQDAEGGLSAETGGSYANCLRSDVRVLPANIVSALCCTQVGIHQSQFTLKH